MDEGGAILISCQTIVVEIPSDSSPEKSSIQVIFQHVEATNPSKLEYDVFAQLKSTLGEILKTLQERS